jgi:hypothetical protein
MRARYLMELVIARMPSMKTVCGVITLVEEGRFQLANEDGVRHLYILAADAPLEARDLEPLQRSGQSVRVRYSDAPNLIARVAQELVIGD